MEIEDVGGRPFVSVLSVNYVLKDQVLLLLRSLNRSNYLNKEVVVVHDSGMDDELKMRSAYPEVHFCRTGKDLPQIEAVNLGLSHCNGDLVLIVSNLLEVEPDFLEPLVEAFGKYPKVGAVSPRIHFYEDPGVLIYAGADDVPALSMRNPIIGHNQKDIGQYMHTRLTSSVHRAAMMISRQVLDEVGLMYEDYIDYYEESDWCHRAREKGFQVVYVGNSLVHLKSSMSKKDNRSRNVYLLTRNRLLFARRNFSWDQRVTSMLFFAFVSIPKNVFSFGIRGEWILMKAFLRGVWWNLTH